MKPLNDKGIALVTALMLTLITLVIILGVMYMVTESTKISAAQKRYRNVVEASYGGAEVVAQDILPQLLAGTATGTLTTTFSSVSMGFPSSASGCLSQKLSSKPGSWTSCTQLNLNPTESPDVTFNLSGTSGPSYTVYSKIVDTVPGVQYQSSTSEGELIGQGVADPSTGTTTTLAHFVYRFEVLAQRSTSVAEKSVLSVLYEY